MKMIYLRKKFLFEDQRITQEDEKDIRKQIGQNVDKKQVYQG